MQLVDFGTSTGLGPSAVVATRKISMRRLGYRSAMNYLYQFSHFDLTKQQTTQTGPNAKSGQPLFRDCPTGLEGKRCFAGESIIPADWSNLVMPSKRIGNAEGTVGLPEDGTGLVEEDITAHELAVIAAEENNLTAGLTLVDAPPAGYGIISNRTSNPITVWVANQGIDAHTFNVVARFNGGQTAPTPVTLAGVEGAKNHTRDIAIDLGPMPGLKGKETQVEFVITNEKGATVFAQEFGLPVLDYTADEAAKVLKDVESSADSAALKEAARERLQPVAKPAPTTTQTPPTSTTPNLSLIHI